MVMIRAMERLLFEVRLVRVGLFSLERKKEGGEKKKSDRIQDIIAAMVSLYLLTELTDLRNSLQQDGDQQLKLFQKIRHIHAG